MFVGRVIRVIRPSYVAPSVTRNFHVRRPKDEIGPDPGDKVILNEVHRLYMMKRTPSVFVSSAAINILLRLQDLARVLTLLKRAKKARQLQVHTYDDLIEALYVEQNYGGALRIYAREEATQTFTAVTHNIIASSFFKTNRHRSGIRHLEYLIVNEIPIHEDTYNSVIRYYIQHNYIDKAFSLYDFVKERSLKETVDTFNEFLRYFFNTERVDNVVLYLGSMDKKDIKPNETTFELITEFVLRTWDPSTFKVSGLKTTDERFLNSLVILFYCKYNQLVQLDYFMKYLEAKNITMPTEMFNHILESACLRNHKRAFDFLLFMNSVQVKPNVDSFEILCSSFCKANLVDYVEQIAGQMKDAGMASIISCNHILSFYARTNRLQQALQLFNTMESDFEVAPDNSSYEILITNLCQFNKHKQAKSLFDSMIERKMKPSAKTYFLLLRNFCKVKNVSSAQDVLERMKSDDISLPQTILTMLHRNLNITL